MFYYIINQLDLFLNYIFFYKFLNFHLQIQSKVLRSIATYKIVIPPFRLRKHSTLWASKTTPSGSGTRKHFISHILNPLSFSYADGPLLSEGKSSSCLPSDAKTEPTPNAKFRSPIFPPNGYCAPSLEKNV